MLTDPLTVDSIVVCERLCARNQDCNSYHYVSNTKICKLLRRIFKEADATTRMEDPASDAADNYYAECVRGVPNFAKPRFRMGPGTSNEKPGTVLIDGVNTTPDYTKICFQDGSCWVKETSLRWRGAPCTPQKNGGALSVFRLFAYTSTVYQDDPRWTKYNFAGVDFDTVRPDALLEKNKKHRIVAAPGYYFLYGSVASHNFVQEVTLEGGYDGALPMLLDESDQDDNFFFRVHKTFCPELETKFNPVKWSKSQLCQPAFMGGDPLASHPSRLFSMEQSGAGNTFKLVSLDSIDAESGFTEFDPTSAQRRQVFAPAMADETSNPQHGLDGSSVAGNQAFLGPSSTAWSLSGSWGSYVEMWGWGRAVVLGVTVGGAGIALADADLRLSSQKVGIGLVRVQGADGDPAGVAWNGNWFDMDDGAPLQIHSPHADDPQSRTALYFLLSKGYRATNVRIKMDRIQSWHRGGVGNDFAMGMRCGILYQEATKETCRDICGRFPTCKGFAMRLSSVQSFRLQTYEECVALSGQMEKLSMSGWKELVDKFVKP